MKAAFKYLLALMAVVGLFTGMAIDRFVLKTLRFEPSINITDLLTLLVTIIIAYSFPTIIQKSLNIKDFRKAQLIQRTERILADFLAIHEKVNAAYLSQTLTADDKTAIVVSFQKVSRDIFLLIELGNKFCPKDIAKKLNDLKTSRSVYKSIITGGSFASLTTIDLQTWIKASKAITIINTDITYFIFDLNAI